MLEIILIIAIIILLINFFAVWKLLSANKDTTFEDIKSQNEIISRDLTKLESTTKDEVSRNRQEIGNTLRDNREEINKAIQNLGELNSKTLLSIGGIQTDKLSEMHKIQTEINSTTESKLEKIRETLEIKIKNLQEDNSKKLDEMRATVDEKLQSTVEKRFSESFKLISERLEQVHKGLGEMQSLASGVGDLKKVLTNVKTRGTLGEIQLGTILEQILSKEQFEHNAMVKPGSGERVEFAVKIPGKAEDGKSVLLPLDSKFPMEVYSSMMDAYEKLPDINQRDVETLSRQFENAVKKNAKNICDKYINPPNTTDFAIMFVPTEGLYAEILRKPGLTEILQREFKVIVVGPTNLVAFLSSLQMGFRTLVIEQRSSEVWELLGAIKTEFGNFGIVLDKTHKKLQQATSEIERAGVRTRAIERKLKSVQELPRDESIRLLGESFDAEADIEADEKGEYEEEEIEEAERNPFKGTIFSQDED
ncbi:MAG: DNA recombination protein RmuC [Bacteroidota bacterium]|nr:DNA recombination protein RmuC [Bacteroidota bacterium]